MKRIHLIFCAAFLCLLPAYIFSADAPSDRQLLTSVADWQIEHFPAVKHDPLDWTNGAFYRGLLAWAGYTNEQRYYDFLLNIGNKNHWGLLHRTYHADDICVSQTYIGLYEKYGDETMIRATGMRLDSIVASPSGAALRFGSPNWSQRWSWCDALFMAPPVYAGMYKISKDEKYLHFMKKEFRETVDSLYDKTEQLFYRDRRFIRMRGEEGEKIFWGRGNAWVFAGLATLLEILPAHCDDYDYYLKLYKDMAARILRCQDASGSWRPDLLNVSATPYPENSCSGFFIYGLAWGINHRILTDKKYEDSARRGWNALKSYVDGDGKLGYIQPVSAAPGKVSAQSTDVYGVGAFLLAGVEMLKMK
jgi:rhamnogalacturonyl hydrolase YesR